MYPEDTALPNPTIGAISELIAAADLMRRGYAVFRALSPANPCDLIVISPDDSMLRIEVRTGKHYNLGKMYFPTRKEDTGRYDHHAVVTYDSGVTTITYFPALPIAT